MARVIAILVTLTGLVYSGANASASCMTDGQGPCNRFWKAEAVFVAKVLDKIPIREWAPSGALLPSEIMFGNSNARLQVRVAEAFRGVEAGAVLTLFAPDDVCGSVDARDGGESFVYASRNMAGELWAAGCGVSGPLENADADLEYARSVTSRGPEGFVFGDVFRRTDTYGDSRDFSAMAGIRVIVSGGGFHAEVVTDDEGNYSITVPDIGPYKVEVIRPTGFVAWWDRSDETVTLPDRRGCYRVPFQLKPSGQD